MTTLPPQFNLSPPPDAEDRTVPSSASGKRKIPQRVVVAGVVLFVILLLVALPILWVSTFNPWLEQRQAARNQPQTHTLPVLASTNLFTETTTPVSATPTPYPALDLRLADGPGDVRWQIAYPSVERGPEQGCAYLSFWLTGSDAERLQQLDELEAQLTIYDGDFIFERYGPAPLDTLRSLAEPRYYELPAGAPECQRYRLAEVEDYAGMQFQLELLAGETVIQRYQRILHPPSLSLVTPTATALPATLTPTPYPQVQTMQGVNVRSGPGIEYPVLGTTTAGERYAVLASTADQSWWQIDFNNQAGWVFATLAQATAIDNVSVMVNLPPTPIPVPTATPIPPTPTATVAPTPYLPFLLSSQGTCVPNAAMTYFEGKVLNREGEAVNGVCVHVAYEGPRNTKCTGCDGAMAGKWGFAPFGNLPGKPVTVRIYVVPCPESMPGGGQNPATGFGPLTPVSPVWTYTIGESVQCTDILFTDNRYFDESGKQVAPPTPTSATPNQASSRLTGTGPGFHQINLEAGQHIFKLTHAGDGTFAVRLVTNTGQQVEQLVASVGRYEGVVSVNIAQKGQYLLLVTAADGAWTVQIESP